MKTSLHPLLELIASGSLLSGVLSSPPKGSAVAKASIRPLMIKEQRMYQLSLFDEKQVRHQNLSPGAAADWVEKALEEFCQGVFSTTEADFHVLVSKKGQMTVLKKGNPAKAILPVVHNRKKNYLLEEGTSISFLVELGVMSKEGKVLAKKYDKFRQVNRFLEMVRDIVPHLKAAGALHIVDFGSGKAYLTFAMYHYLHHILGKEVVITGLDLKKEVVEECERLARKLHYKNLHFTYGDIHSYQGSGKIDMMISLHACDTATDAALEKAIASDVDVIFAVPCCQKELFKQIDNSALATLLRHGILKERFASLATDAARADLLEAAGYETQVLEFIDMEHTPKNILIRGVKGASSQKRAAAKERYLQMKAHLHISPSLEKMLHHL